MYLRFQALLHPVDHPRDVAYRPVSLELKDDLDKDQGPPFDPSTTPPRDLTSELEKRKVGGLGVYFVRRVMDSISHEYRDGMNVVTMTKKIS